MLNERHTGPNAIAAAAKADESTISGMRLMDGISIFVAKLLYDLLDAIKVFACSKISNDTFKTVEFVSTFRQRRLSILTLRLQPFSYRKACRSRPVGCSDPFRNQLVARNMIFWNPAFCIW